MINRVSFPLFPDLRFTKRSFLFLVAILSFRLASAQDPATTIQQYLDGHLATYQLDPSDVTNLEITSQHTSGQSGVTYVYARQTYDGIPVANGVANFAIKGGQVVHMGSRLIPQLRNKIARQTPSLTPMDAIQATARHLKLNSPRDLQVVEAVSSRQFLFSPGGISRDEIPVQLMYHAISPKDIRLVWDMLIYTPDGEHWWSMRVDALKGEVVDQKDMILHCQFDESPFAHHAHQTSTGAIDEHQSFSGVNPDQYNVIPLPAESPNHGAHAIVSNPADLVASPYGWHDADGQPGAEYTFTRGNNVYAYEDADNDDNPGFSPDGTAALDFNFPYLPGDDPANYQAAAITNLFYMNNMMHDIWYQYGFDEASGNFQAFNYLGSEGANDYVLAEAQDGGGLNNANFGTPPDGSNPRMQMYLWNNTVPGNFLLINSPADIAREYLASAGSFGPPLPDMPVTGDIVLLIDDTDPVNDGCNTIINGLDLAGKIALIDRGNCTFVEKVEAAQDAGAIAVIIVNNIPGDPTQMGGSSGSIFIPSIMISQADGDTIKSRLLLGSVNGAVSDGDGAVNSVEDGDFDNGIIAHEYGHGISNRLVGGKGDVGCLFNAEQMGEGWSDWFGLMLTMEPGDLATDPRGIGTFAINQSTTSTGIRPAPYSTDFNINGYTYGASNDFASISQPHGVGFIFATMLWDLNWALIDAYGGTPDPDLYTGSGGNNIAMRLIIEGLKLTVCGPGMEDGRDAILEADQLLYDGAHQCLIWEVFARRGLGYSADQGSADSRTDQVEAFDIPPTCQTATELPVAAFTVDTLLECTRTVTFTDSSYSIPQAWFWDFGDGNTSSDRHPTHTYVFGGSYTVKLVVTNTIGQDSTTREIQIVLPPSPIAEDLMVCAGDPASIPAVVTGRAFWKDTANTVVYIGDTLVLSDVQSVQTYYVENHVGEPSQFVGPTDGSISGGGYHGSGYFGATNFTAERDFTIVSAWVDAPTEGERTFILAEGSNSDGEIGSLGNIIQQVTVNIPAGQSRVTLDLKVPSAGDYTLGASLSPNTTLFRNNGGADFPFVLPGFLTMNSSSAGNDPFLYYYYLYDWEVRAGDLCISDPDTVTVTPVRSQFDFVDEGNATLLFTDLSVGATSWHWDFGDGNTSTEQNPSHTYNDEGEYTITLTINDGLCSTTQTYTVLISSSGNQLNALALILQPNPAHDEATLRLNEPVTEDLEVMVKDISGKAFHQFTWVAGKRDQSFDVSTWPGGIYILDVKGYSYTAVRKLVVEK